MITNMFKAMLVTGFEDNKLSREIVNRDVNDLPQGDVLINVKYSSLNYSQS